MPATSRLVHLAVLDLVTLPYLILRRRSSPIPATSSGQDLVWRRGKHLLHLPAHLHGAIGRIDHHIRPVHQFTRSDGLGELPPVRQSERQGTGLERVGGWHQPADHRVAALPIQNLAGLEVALGGGDGVGTEARWAAGWLVTDPDRGDGDADLQANQVPALVQARIPPGGIGAHAVLGEAATDILRVASNTTHTPKRMS